MPRAQPEKPHQRAKINYTRTIGGSGLSAMAGAFGKDRPAADTTKNSGSMKPVSYTHLTLPTILLV